MNNSLQASRAGPSLPIGPSIKPAIIKDSRAGTLFAAFLTSEIKRDQERKTEEPEPAGNEREPVEKSCETVCAQSAVRDPLESLMAAAYQAPAKLPEPPASDGGSKQACDSGSIEKTAGSGTAAASLSSAAGQPVSAPPTAAEASTQGQKAAQADTPADAANAASTAQADTFQSALKIETASTIPLLAASRYNPSPEVATAARQPDLVDLQVPAPAHQAPQIKQGAGNPADQADLQAATNPASGSTNQAAATSAANQAQNPAKMTPEQAKAAADAAATAKVQATAPGDPGGSREVQTALGGSNLSTNPLQSFEPARLAEAQNKGMIWQVCQNVETMLKNRQTSMRLTLFPEDLGRIDLRLTTGTSGMGISMVAQHANTGHMLESQLAQLRQALDQAGIQLAHLSVGQQRSQAGSDQPGQQSRGQSSGQPQHQAVQQLVEERSSRNSLEPTEGYDYLV